MISPLTALILASLAMLILAWFFWPQKGLIARWRRGAMNTDRVLLEDALKHLYDCEYKSNVASLDSIAGNLGISADRAAKLIASLEAMGLIKSSPGLLLLSEVGRSYALRVIRVHRVWERYLADETGHSEIDWHAQADLQEHIMSLEEANELAAQIGNPVFDPHGDPIPTAKGELPKHKGQALSTLHAGQFAQITHLEDEPPTIYAQLIAQGLFPGMKIRMNSISDEKVTFIANGEERVLAPIFAANVTVSLLAEKESIEENFNRLSELKVGEKAEVLRISAACRGQQRRRLMDFGIVPGTIITAELQSAGGDPTAYRILGATIALRREHAQFIFVKE